MDFGKKCAGNNTFLEKFWYSLSTQSNHLKLVKTCCRKIGSKISRPVASSA
jgi:hypothetical protein